VWVRRWSRRGRAETPFDRFDARGSLIGTVVLPYVIDGSARSVGLLACQLAARSAMGADAAETLAADRAELR
jgi:hypothetical protein